MDNLNFGSDFGGFTVAPVSEPIASECRIAFDGMCCTNRRRPFVVSRGERFGVIYVGHYGLNKRDLVLLSAQALGLAVATFGQVEGLLVRRVPHAEAWKILENVNSFTTGWTDKHKWFVLRDVAIAYRASKRQCVVCGRGKSYRWIPHISGYACSANCVVADHLRRNPPEIQKPRQATVYFMEAVGLNRVKIGYSTQWKTRVKGLQTSSPVPLKLIGRIKGTTETELSLHYKFRHLRVQGEWFELTDELRQFIQEHARRRRSSTKS